MMSNSIQIDKTDTKQFPAVSTFVFLILDRSKILKNQILVYHNRKKTKQNLE